MNGGKKRKLDVVDPDAERHLYTSFVSAANAITQLYATAQQQQRNASATASRQALVRRGLRSTLAWAKRGVFSWACLA